jgi:hypothetical protein
MRRRRIKKAIPSRQLKLHVGEGDWARKSVEVEG